MELTSYLGDIRFLQTDLVLAGVYRDERPPQGLAGLVDWYLFGQLTDLLLTDAFAGEEGRFALIATQGKIAAPKFMVVGLGERGAMSPDRLRELWRGVAGGLREIRVNNAAVEFLGAAGRPFRPEPAARLLLEALADRDRPPVKHLMIVPAQEDDQETLEKLIR